MSGVLEKDWEVMETPENSQKILKIFLQLISKFLKKKLSPLDSSFEKKNLHQFSLRK